MTPTKTRRKAALPAIVRPARHRPDPLWLSVLVWLPPILGVILLSLIDPQRWALGALISLMYWIGFLLGMFAYHKFVANPPS